MQATLLAICIAIILALVAALAGPYFVDWSQYRSVFEAEASRASGMPVRITGAIDLRLLPTPSLALRGVEAGPPGAARLKARHLAVELKLGPLLRGELRAAELRLVGPEIRLGLNADGRIDWPAMATGVDPDQLAIDGLAVEDGRAILTDAGGGAGVTLDKLWFNGELRSLAGPVKGEGGFLIGEERYGYRLSSGRRSDDATTRVRLSIDPADRPLTVEADGLLRFERGAPRFDGALTLARPAGVAASQGHAGAVPWRLAGKVKASPAAALFEQIDFQYGPDERALKLTGVADIKFGKRPRFEGVISARQIDLDGVLDLPEPARRQPLAAIRVLATDVLGALEISMPGRVGIGIDSVTLAGGQVQAVRGDLRHDASGFDLEAFEFRAPGFAQTRLSGRLGVGPQGVTFHGPAALDVSDPKTFVAWLEGRSDPARRQLGALRLSGDVSIDGGRIAVDRLKSEVDRQVLEGRLAYSFAADRPTRLETALKAAELDIDQLIGLVQAAAGGSRIEWPSELDLALDVGEASIAGFGARNATVRLKSDANGVVLEKLSVGDLGGTSFDLAGRIEQWSTTPHGRMTVELESRGFDGVLALLARVAPQAAEIARPVLARLLPMKGRATLTVATGGTAKLTIDGTAGTVRLALTTEAKGDLHRPAALALTISGEASAEDGRELTALLGLDHVVAVDKTRATFSLVANGALDAELRANARLAAGGLTAMTSGTVRLGGDGPSAALDLALAADLSPLRRDTPGSFPVGLKTKLTTAGDALTFDDLSGTVVGTPIHGRLGVVLSSTPRIEGRLDVDAVDAAAVIASLVGVTARKPAGAADTWWSEPFGPGRLEGLTGSIAFNVPRAALAPTLVARSLRGTLRFGDGEVALEDLDGQLGGGQIQGQLSVNRVADGLSTHVRVNLTGADATLIVRAGARPPVVGRLSLQVEGDGAGLSPAALIGSLRGSGVLTYEQGQLAGFDPKVFDTVPRAVDQGLAIDATRIRDIVTTVLDGGALRVARAEGALTITSGQMRLANVIARGEGADLMISGNLDLAEGLIDARLILSGPPDRETGAGRPDIFVALKGPLAAPRRTIDVSALAGWLMLRAVERETKRIEKLEAERHESALGSIPQPPTTPAVATPPETRTPPTTVNVEPPQIQPPQPQPPQAQPPAPPPRAPTKPSRPEASLTPSDRAPPLPPPVEIRPLQGAGKPARPPRTGIANPGQPPIPPMPIPDPPPSRGVLDQLFGAQR